MLTFLCDSRYSSSRYSTGALVLDGSGGWCGDYFLVMLRLTGLCEQRTTLVDGIMRLLVLQTHKET